MLLTVVKTYITDSASMKIARNCKRKRHKTKHFYKTKFLMLKNKCVNECD